MIDALRFPGTNVVVTGAASGIGAAVTRQLVALEAHVVAVDIDAEGLSLLRKELGQDAITAVTADVQERAAAEWVSATLAATRRPLKALVNNVGANRRAPFIEVSDDDWAAAIQVNLTSAFVLTQTLLPLLLAAPRGGSVVSVSSAHGLRGQPGATGYATAKAGLIGFTRQLAAEHAADGLRVNVVCPALTMTERIVARGAGAAQEKLRDRLLSGRFAEPDEIANAITFLASDAASYVTGVVLPVDGGFTAR